MLGVPTPLYKALVYSLSAFLPAIAGGLYFFKSAFIQPSDAFDLSLSTEAIVIVMLGGQGTDPGPALGAYLYEELRGWLLTSDTFSNFQLVIAGVLLLVIVLFAPGGLMGWLYARWPRTRRCSNDGAPRRSTAWARNSAACSAVEGLSFTVERGRDPRPDRPQRRRQIDGLQPHQRRLPPDAGRVVFGGDDITGEAPYRVARHGLARTHQIVQPLARHDACSRIAPSAPASAARICRWRGRATAAREARVARRARRPARHGGVAAHHRRQEAPRARPRARRRGRRCCCSTRCWPGSTRPRSST